MKNSKSKRVLSVVLAALMTITAIPTTAFAALPDDMPSEMKENVYLDALAYTGYDVQAQIDDGSLYSTCAGGVDSSILSNITYSSEVYPTGLETTDDGTPDIGYFEQNGLVCASYVSYVLFNYLPNVAGIDTSAVMVPYGPASVGYYAEAAEQWVEDGVATCIYSADYGTAFDYDGDIPIGSVIIMAGVNDAGDYSLWNAGHVCLYAGKYNDYHYVTHVGNDRGPEICRMDWLEGGSAGGKDNRYVVSIYALDINKKYGNIEVSKTSDDGNNLAGAVFVATNDTTDTEYIIGPTDNSGYAISGELPYGDYTIKETVFPTGYTKSDTDTWYVTVSRDNNGLASFSAVNNEEKGSLKVIKNSEDNYVEGLKFNLKGTSLTGKSVDMTVSTNADGIAMFNEVPVSGDTPYTLTEVDIPDRYEDVKPIGVTIEWDKTTTKTVNNTLKKGWLEVDKKDDETGTLLPNAKYGVYSELACTNKVDTLTTDSNGYAKSKKLPIGTYYVKEITAPSGYVLDVNSYEGVVAYNKTTSLHRTDKEQYGALTIYKEGEVLTAWNGSNFVYETKKLAGATFKVTAGADIYRADGTKVYSKGDLIKDNLVTGRDGSVTLKNLHLGTYVVTETGTINGFTLNKSSKTVKIEYKDQTVDVQYEAATITNTRQKAEVSVIKKDAETKNGLLGAEFTIYATNDIVNYAGEVVVSKGSALQTIATVKGGTGAFTLDLPINNGYKIAETKAPYGYVRNTADVYSFRFDYLADNQAKATFTHTYTDERVKAKIQLNKVDLETGIPQGDAKLDGAVYGLYARNDIVHPDGTTGVMYKAGSLVATLTTNKDGFAEAGDLYLGNYYVKEIKASEGYLVDEAEHDLICNYEGDFVAEITRSTTSPEQVMKQPFQLIKIAYSCGDTEGELLENAGFTAYLKSSLSVKEDGSYDFDSASPVVIGNNGETTLYTDDKGYLVTTPIPYGTYVVIEAVTPHNYKTIKPFEVVVSENHPTEPQVWRVFMDREFDAKLRIIKKDAATGKTVLLPNASFKIFNLDTNEYVSQVTTYPSVVVHDVFTTDEDGDLILPSALSVGNYRIEEVAAPFGYVVSDKTVTIAVDTDTFYEVDEVAKAAIINVPFDDEPVRGELSVIKTGDVLVDYKDGAFVYENRGLAGAVFEVYAAEDIATADNQVDDNGNRTLYYHSGDLVATLITGTDGKAVLSELPLGKYRVIEVTAPSGFVINETVEDVTFEYVDDRTPVIEESVSFNNDRQKLSMSIVKKDSETLETIAGAEFGLYANEDIISVDGKVLVKADTLLEKVVSDEDGIVKFTKDYPFVAYTAKELKQPAGYVSNDSVIIFNTMYQGQDKRNAEYVREFLNTPTTVEVSKTDITTGREIPGAKLTVYDKDGNVVDSWESVAGENHIIKRLIVGETYTLREKMAPYGYLKAEDVQFTVNDTAQIQKVSIKDDVPTGTIIIHKTGEKLVGSKPLPCGATQFIYEQKPLSGVEFELYALEDIVRPDGSGEVLIAKDELVGTVITDIEGKIIVDFLPVGKYYAIETSTIEGYVLDKTPIKLDVSYVDQNTKVVYCDKTVKNERQKVEISIVKKDSENNEPLADAEFGLYTATDIYTANGQTILKAGSLVETAKSDKDGIAIFKTDLPLGTYFVKELSSPAGYVKSNEVFDINTNDIDASAKVYSVTYEYKNDRIKVDFTKTDITGNHEIEGAKLSVIDKDGTIIETWTSGKEAHRIELLPVGTYKLREESAPYGYRIAEEVEFKVLETNEVQKVSMKDDTPKARIIINKTDKVSGKPIAGVEFEIRNDAGEVVETLVTDENGHAESQLLAPFYYKDGKYTASRKYTVVETKAAAGYKLDSTEYEVIFDYEGNAPEVIVYTLDVTNISDNPDKPDAPNTGDNTPMHLYLAMLGLSMAGISVIMFSRKKKRL